MSEFGGLRKHEKTQHALKSSTIIGLLIVATMRKTNEKKKKKKKKKRKRKKQKEKKKRKKEKKKTKTQTNTKDTTECLRSFAQCLINT